MGGTCRICGSEENTFKTLVGKPERKKPHGKPRHRWKDKIRVGSCGLDASGSGQRPQ